jgi:hypothetical protein
LLIVGSASASTSTSFSACLLPITIALILFADSLARCRRKRDR